MHIFLNLSRDIGNEPISHMRTSEVQASARICAVSPEPNLFAQVSGRLRGNFSQRTRHVVLLRGRIFLILPRFFFFLEITAFNANSTDPDQTPQNAASDLGLHCLPLSL